MKIVVERDAFASAVSSAARVIKNGPTIPICQNVLLSLDDDTLRVRGTDLEFVTETIVKADVQANGSNERATTVPAKTLASVCDGLPKGAHITLEWQAGPVTVRSGRSRYSLHSLPASDYPEFPLPTGACSFALPGDKLSACIEAVSFAISDDKSRANLHGINLAVEGKNLVFATTDGTELARVTMRRPDGAAKMPTVTVPAHATAEIARLAKGSQEVTAHISPNKIAIVAGQTTLISKLIEASFPDYDAVMKIGRPNHFIGEVADLIGALTRLRALEDDARLRVVLDGGIITLSPVKSQHGDADEKLDVEYDGKPTNFGVKSSGFLSILNSIDTERCIFRFADRTKPFLVQPYFKEAIDARQFLTAPVHAPG